MGEHLGEYRTVLYSIGDVGIPVGAGEGPALPLPSLSPFASNLKKIESGKEHIVFLLNSGEIYVCGSGEKGQLGLCNYDDQLIPVALPAKVFPQLEYRQNYFSFDPTSGPQFCAPSEEFLMDPTTEEADVEPHPEDMPKDQPNMHPSFHIEPMGETDENGQRKTIRVFLQQRYKPRVVDIAAGDAHTVILTKQGRVYSWGQGKSAQLGLGKLVSTNRPYLVTALKKFRVIKVSAGCNHSAALTETGQVYTWGRGLEGQLAHGDFHLQHSPHLVSSLYRQFISNVECAYNHSAFITGVGNVYICGEGVHGSLGQGDTKTRNVPSEVKLLEKDPTPRLTMNMLAKQQKGMGTLTVSDIAIGWSHVVFLDDGGKLYSCGLNSKGQLGFGIPSIKVRTPEEIPLFHTLPQPELDTNINERVAAAMVGSDIGDEVPFEGEVVHELGSDTSSQIPINQRATTLQASQGAPTSIPNPSTPAGSVRSINTAATGQRSDVTQIKVTPESSKVEKGNLNAGPIHLDKVKPSQVVCGKFWSAALTETGHLYSWGSFGAHEFGKQPVYINQQLPYESKVLKMWSSNYDGAFLLVEEFIPFVPVCINVRINQPLSPDWQEEAAAFVKTKIGEATKSNVQIGMYEHAGTMIVLHGNTQSLIENSASTQTVLQAIIARLATKRVEFWHDIPVAGTLILTVAANIDFDTVNVVPEELHGFELDVTKCALLGLVRAHCRPETLPAMETLIGKQSTITTPHGDPLYSITDLTLEDHSQP